MAKALELGAEDEKLVILARSARARTGAAEAGAVRDTDGRTYVGTSVEQPSFTVTSLQSAIAAAIASGAEGIEAAAVVTSEPLVSEANVHAVRDFARHAPIYRASPDGVTYDVLP